MAQKRIQLTNLIPGQKYAVRITSISSDGNLSDSSPTFSFTTIKDITPPLPVTSASVDFNTPTFILTWDSASSKQSRDFKNFQVTLSASSTSSSFVYFTESPLVVTFEENYKIFNGAVPKINFSIKAQDNYGNFSEPYSGSASNIPPTETPTISASGISDGFYASWSPVSSSFNDYSYTEIYSSSSPTYNASAVGAIWRGTSTAVTYSKFAFNGYNTAYLKARHFDVFNQPSSDSNTVAITPLPPVTLTTTPPSNTSLLTVTALNDSTGTTAFSGQIIATWTPSSDSNSRGYRLRIRQIYEQFYQYENTASNVTSYHIGSLIPGETYEVGIATYDQLNNTSSYVLASPSAITIPYGTASSQSLNASATQNSNIIVLLDQNVSASMIGQLISGYGLVAGTIITGSVSGASATISPNSGSAFSGSIILYPGMSNWRSYITAGTPTSTSSYMKLGTGVNGTQSGLYLNNSNYWYTSGNLRVGTSSAYLSWDGNQLTTSGNIVAKSGSFDGNVQLTQGSLYAGSSPTANPRVIYNASGIIGYTSSGSTGFLLDANSGNLYASSAYISGSVIFTAGYVGGWTVDSTSLYNASVGFYAPVSPALTEIAIFAGSAVANRTVAPFRVNYAGAASMTNAYVSGSIIATSGSIGGLTIVSNKMYIGNGTYNSANTPFYVDSTGSFSLGSTFRVFGSSASLANAYFSGSIIATSGSIGGWSIGASGISRSYGNTISIGNVVIENSYGINLNVSSSYQNIWMVRPDGSVYFKAGDGNVTSGKNYISLDSSSVYVANNGIQFNNGVFKVDYLGNLTSTAGTIGGWTIATNKIYNPANTASIIGGGLIQIGDPTVTSNNLITLDYNNGFKINQTNSYGAIRLYDGIDNANSEYAQFNQSSLQLFDPLGTRGNTFVIQANNNRNITLNSTDGTTSIQGNVVSITSGLSISIGNDLGMASKDINIGYGTSLSSRALVKSNAIYNYTSTSGAANVAIASSPLAALYRFTSTFTAKEQITPLSDYSKLDPIVPIERISSSSTSIDAYRVLNLTPVWFKSSLPSDEGKSNIGFIAEDVMQKYPELAIVDEEGQVQLYNINGIVASMLVVIQRQEKIISELSASVIKLQNSI